MHHSKDDWRVKLIQIITVDNGLQFKLIAKDMCSNSLIALQGLMTWFDYQSSANIFNTSSFHHSNIRISQPKRHQCAHREKTCQKDPQRRTALHQLSTSFKKGDVFQTIHMKIWKFMKIPYPMFCLLAFDSIFQTVTLPPAGPETTQAPTLHTSSDSMWKSCSLKLSKWRLGG